MALHEARLLRKGWSAGEIEHAKQILDRAGTQHAATLLSIERATLALLIFLVTIGSAGIGYVAATLTRAVPWRFAAGAVLLLGASIGWLTWHAIHTLQTRSFRARIAVAVMVIAAGIAYGLGSWSNGGLWLVVAIAYAAGMGSLVAIGTLRSVDA